MFFPIARLRTTVLSSLLFVAFAHSKEESLFTSSVTYCEPPETLFIQQFDVAYIAKNESIFFNITAASVSPNVSVTANLLLNVYGTNPVNVTLDLCNILGGALCPLPTYNFSGSDTLSLPSSLSISQKIPGIAFKIPDLEAFAQLTLVEVGTGKTKACVQATLSNGWSSRQTAVEWSTGGFALLALLSALWQSAMSDALPPYRLIDLLHLYQSIVTTGFLNLNYPSVYRAFTLNFAWAMGFIPTSPTSSIQNSINRMRYLTGGSLANATSGSAVGLVNRKLSPYNVPTASNFVILQSFLPAATPLELNILSFNNGNSTNSLSSFQLSSIADFSPATEVQTVTSGSSNILQAGIPIYVNSVHIATANAFATVFINTLILIVIGLVTFGFAYVALRAVECFGCARADFITKIKRSFLSFFLAWTLRLVLVTSAPTFIFAFYQWTLKDSWLSMLLSIILFLTIGSYLVYTTTIILRSARRSSPQVLYEDHDQLLPHEPLYAQFRVSRYYVFVPLLVATFLRASFIAFVKGNGEAQIILMVVVELFVFLIYVVLQPHKTKGGDILSTYLAVVRLVAAGLSISFSESLNVAAIPRVVIGIVIAVIYSVAVVVMIFNTILHCGLEHLWRRKTHLRAESPQSSANESMLEKGDVNFEDSESQQGRQVNPTPERNILLHPIVNHSYPLVMPSPTTAGSDATTFRTLLPRRWFFMETSPHKNHL